MGNKGFTSLVLMAVLVTLLGITAIFLFPKLKNQLQQGDKNQTTLIVEVPVNTPEYSTIYIEWRSIEDNYWQPFDHCKLVVDKDCALKKIGKNKWQGQFNLAPGKYGYRYSRDQWGAPTAEEFWPDSLDKYREIEVKEGKQTFTDQVGKWRWFPHPNEPPLSVPPSTAQTATITPRIGGEKFQRGFAIQDFWDPWFNVLIEPTHKAIKADYADYVAVGPVWEYTQVEPLPVISESRLYPMEDLKIHLDKLKEDRFRIYMSVQYGCPVCNGLHPFEKPRSQEWWDAWYKEIEKTSFYFADLAQKYDVETLSLFGGVDFAWQSEFRAPNAEKKFSQLLDRIRQRYSGKIGIGVVLGGKPPEWQEAWPPPTDIPAFEKYDFIALGLVAALVENDNSTQEQVNVNSKKLFKEKIEPLYAQYKKPIVLTPGYASYKGVLQNTEKYTEEEIMIWAPMRDDIELGGQEQAMAYEAIMNAVADAPYVIGTYPFGYQVEEFPLSRVEDVRGKPAEKIIAGWYKQFGEK